MNFPNICKTKWLLAPTIALLSTGSVSAQGAGTSGAAALTLEGGARSAALGGAYAAIEADANGVFQNPAALARLDLAFSVGYARYFDDVSRGSLAAVGHTARLRIGAGIAYLDAGEIEEIVPDPRFHGDRGQATGRTVSAMETTARLAFATAISRRSGFGATIGLWSSELAGNRENRAFLDLGAQHDFGAVTLGALLRNMHLQGVHRSGREYSLPLEVRVGAGYRTRFGGVFGFSFTSDAIVAVEEETLAFAFGGEAGLLPRADGVSAVLRLGVAPGSGADLGRLRIGGGVGIDRVEIDYVAQSYEFIGTVHRLGFRWSR